MGYLRKSTSKQRLTRRQAALFGSVVLVGVGLAMPACSEIQPPPVSATIASGTVEDGYADLAAAVMPAVVNVRVERRGTAEGGPDSPMDDPEMRRFFERFFGQVPEGVRPRRMVGEGSGFIVSPDGLIVTNYHVAGEADEIVVTLSSGEELKATLRGADQKSDLALIEIKAGKPLPYVTWGDSGKVRPGDRVIAIGNPFGLGGTVTSGIVSATGREIGSGPYDDFLQIDAPINRGNSGGPAFNLRGEVIGVNTAIFSPSGGSVGIGFAISSNQARQVVDELMRHGTVERGFLGVGIQSIDADLARVLALDGTKGALVSEVEAGGPAEKAGIEPGDVILEFDGRTVEKAGQLSRYAAATPAGKTVEAVLWRDGTRKTVRIEVGRMPGKEEVASADRDRQADNRPKLGLSLARLTPDARARLGLRDEVDGVVVAQVEPDSPADRKGIRPGDVILGIDGKPVEEPRQVVDGLQRAQAEGDRVVLLLIMRNGEQIFEAVPLASS